MPRVKRSVHARKKRRKVLEQAKGYWGLKKSLVPVREGAGRALASLRVPRPQEQEAHVPAALDHPDQRGGAAERDVVQPVHVRAAQGRDPARPQGARRARGERPAGVRRDRRAGEGRARRPRPGLNQREVFEAQALQCEGRSPLYADLCRRFAVDPAVAATRRRRVRPGTRRCGCSAGCTTSCSRARRSGTTRSSGMRRSCASSCATQRVQTNEVQRSWVLLPCFLRAAELLGADELDVVELGPSAGLNLVWDRYRYAYEAGEWGPADAPLRLAGRRADAGSGASCSNVVPRVRRRVGIDVAPLDVTTDEGARLLESFVWAGQEERFDRLRRAIDVVRADPPELGARRHRRGAAGCARRTGRRSSSRPPSSGTSTMRRCSRCGRRSPSRGALLAFVSAGGGRSDEPAWGMRIFRPDHEREFVGHADFHGAWLDYSLLERPPDVNVRPSASRTPASSRTCWIGSRAAGRRDLRPRRSAEARAPVHVGPAWHDPSRP